MSNRVKILVAWCLLLSVQGAQAGQAQDHNRALSVLEKSENILRAGTMITAKISNINDGKNEKSSTVWERCYISGDKLRVDTINDFQAGKPIDRSSIVTVQILSPKLKVEGAVLLKKSYKDTTSLFSRLVANPPPQILATEGVDTVSAQVLQVLGFGGTRWLGDDLKSTSDGSVIAAQGTQIVTFGAKTPLLTEITLKNGSGLPEGYSYKPNNGNKWFKSFQIKMISSSDGLPTYEAEVDAGPGSAHYKAQIVDLKHQHIPDSIFQYADVNNSLYMQNGGKDVYTVVNGKRIKNYNRQKARDEAAGIDPISIAIIASGALLIGLVVYRFFKNRPAT